mmetsp:Transcript_12931/g.27387  ORF Transcript_12931/g.27387 Transcript_12931/m.27387 type:complete len:254 (-) Transcript_12931:34-795(-)
MHPSVQPVTHNTLTATMLYIPPAPTVQEVTLQNESDLKNIKVRDCAMVANAKRTDTIHPTQHLSHRNNSRVARARPRMPIHGARNPHTMAVFSISVNDSTSLSLYVTHSPMSATSNLNNPAVSVAPSGASAAGSVYFMNSHDATARQENIIAVTARAENIRALRNLGHLSGMFVVLCAPGANNYSLVERQPKQRKERQVFCLPWRANTRCVFFYQRTSYLFVLSQVTRYAVGKPFKTGLKGSTISDQQNSRYP